MALQQDPRKRAPRYTETYSKRNYQPSKKPLVLITAGIVACTVAVAAVAVSCQGGFDAGNTSNPGTTITDPNTGGNTSSENGGETPSTNGKKDSDSKDDKDNSGNAGKSDASDDSNGSSVTSTDKGNGSGSASTSNKYTPGQSIQVPSSMTTTSSGSSAFNKPAVSISFSPKREKSSLETYYDRLSNRVSKLDSFCDKVFNDHLGSSYATLVKDYDKFEKLRKKVLDGIVDSDGDWVIYSYYGDKYLDAKVDMAKASKLLVKRLDMIDEAYQAMFALGKDASSDEYVSAANKKLKDFAATTKKMNKLVKSAKSSMGL